MTPSAAWCVGIGIAIITNLAKHKSSHLRLRYLIDTFEGGSTPLVHSRACGNNNIIIDHQARCEPAVTCHSDRTIFTRRKTHCHRYRNEIDWEKKISHESHTIAKGKPLSGSRVRLCTTMVISLGTCPYYCLYNAPSSRPYNHHDNNNNDDDDDDDNSITMRIMITLETGLGGIGVLCFIAHFRARTNTNENK